VPLPPDDQTAYRGLVNTVRPPRPAWDDDEPDHEATTYTAATPGPSPVPSWVITEDAARQYELGILKTGKEADVHLVQRTLGERVNLLAAKRYRDFEDRLFRDDSRYRRRRTGNRRVDLAMDRGTKAGMEFRASLWVDNEFDVLGRLWEAGAAVPYPVQLLGNELLLEYFGDADGAAPRLVAARVDMAAARDLYAQAVELLRALVRCGVVHGDLSPYNLLVWEGRLVMIDLPQAVDPLAQADGLGLLERDVTNVCTWFARKGVDTAPDDVIAELVSLLF
jgi:RIO kinase 1